jgi:hypothetical protein
MRSENSADTYLGSNDTYLGSSFYVPGIKAVRTWDQKHTYLGSNRDFVTGSIYNTLQRFPQS